MKFNPTGVVRTSNGAGGTSWNKSNMSPTFQSTRPARGATVPARMGCRGVSVSIHAPRAGRDGLFRQLHQPIRVSIHAPRAGRDPVRWEVSLGWEPFQSTRPARGATTDNGTNMLAFLFQSTRPARGATRTANNGWHPESVSIHAPRAGRDRRQCRNIRRRIVSIHAPRAGRDLAIHADKLRVYVSIHAPRAGRDGRAWCTPTSCACFNPRAPRGARRRCLAGDSPR